MEGVKACYPKHDDRETVLGGQCLVARHSPVGMETADGLEFFFFDEEGGEVIGSEDFAHYQSLTRLDLRAAHFWWLYRERRADPLEFPRKKPATAGTAAKFAVRVGEKRTEIASDSLDVKPAPRTPEWEETQTPGEETEFSSSYTLDESYIEEFHQSDGSLEIRIHFEDMEGYPTGVPIPPEKRANYEALKNEVTEECYPLENGGSVCFQIFEGADVLRFTCLDPEGRKARWGTYGALIWDVESLKRDCE